MNLLYRFYGILMVFVICIAIGIEGAAYDEACSTDTDCTEANAEKCDSGTSKCICKSGFFRKTSAAECAAQVAALGDNCVAAETQPDQCAVDGSECHDDGAGTVTCLCKDTHFTNGAACTTKIVLNAACTTSPNGQCADALAACDGTALVCTCSAGNFEKNDGTCAGQVAALDGACVTAETATDQCAIADSECRTDQCLCKATHYKDGTACTARIAPGDTCAANQCVEHATCDTTTTNNCECDAGYTASPATSPTMCSGVVKFASLSYMYVVPILVSMMSLLR